MSITISAIYRTIVDNSTCFPYVYNNALSRVGSRGHLRKYGREVHGNGEKVEEDDFGDESSPTRKRSPKMKECRWWRRCCSKPYDRVKVGSQSTRNTPPPPETMKRRRNHNLSSLMDKYNEMNSRMDASLSVNQLLTNTNLPYNAERGILNGWLHSMEFPKH